jgi:exosortase H (IPTLxxWG-CTERM-specific)
MRRPARFAITFGCCFLLGIGLLFTPPIQSLDGKFSRALVDLSKGLIGICGGKVRGEGAILRDPTTGFAIEMKDGCNAVNVTLLLWSAMIAFPAPWRRKAAGLLAGSLIIQVLNIVRFISLFYIGLHSMSWFDFAHSYLWESLLILDTMVVFWLWVRVVSRSEIRPHAAV